MTSIPCCEESGERHTGSWGHSHQPVLHTQERCWGTGRSGGADHWEEVETKGEGGDPRAGVIGQGGHMPAHNTQVGARTWAALLHNHKS